MQSRFLKTDKRMLNLGCGLSYHPDWVNIDFVDHGGKVLAYDLNLGIPYGDDTFDLVYHSHVLEHFTRENGLFFLFECFRVLRPGGLFRIAVPDLEGLVRAYLKTVDAAREGAPEADSQHDWMLIELLDQLVRIRSGGAMGEYWSRREVPAEDFVKQRTGDEYVSFRKRCVLQDRDGTDIPNKPIPLELDVSFLKSGELHRWMYDAISLAKTLHRIGFVGARQMGYNTSSEPYLLEYRLDATEEGIVRKPDSLFMEARKAESTSSGKAELKVVLLATSNHEEEGGAAGMLNDALTGAGASSEMYVARLGKAERNTHVFPGKGRVVEHQHVYTNSRWAEGYARALAKLERDYPDALKTQKFSLNAAFWDIASLAFVEDYDALILHGAHTFLDLELLADSPLANKPVLLVVSDMRSFTGGCHDAGTCSQYTQYCGACPQLCSSDKNDLSFQQWRQQKGAYRKLNIQVVATSRELAVLAGNSGLLNKFPVHVIEDGVPLDVFRPLNRKVLRENLGFSDEEIVIGVSDMAELEHGLLAECFSALRSEYPDGKFRFLLPEEAVPSEFDNAPVQVDAIGRVVNPENRAVFYNVLDMFLATSADSLPALREAAGCGTPTLAFVGSKAGESVSHEKNGWLMEQKTGRSLAAGVSGLASKGAEGLIRRQCRATALERWNASSQARQYLDLIETACSG